MPTKGRFKLKYFSGPNFSWTDVALRVALTCCVLPEATWEQDKIFRLQANGMSRAEYVDWSLRTQGSGITWTYDEHANSPMEWVDEGE
jgi:hypothetical protein